MKIIDEAYAVRLKVGAATTCLCWLFEREDGKMFGATDHDRELRIDGIDYLPDRALSGAEFTSNAGFAPGHVSGRSALSADFVNEQDLAFGLWDGTRVKVWRVDWERPDLKYFVWSGFIGKVERNGQDFQVELISLKAQLETRIGRIYTRQCSAQLGDFRCQVNVAQEKYSVTTHILEVLSNNRLKVENIGTFDSGWFTGGRIVFADGKIVSILSQENTQLALGSNVGMKAGDSVRLIAGCSKFYSTCRSKFENEINFQGFPNLPGMDVVLSGPSANGVNDGGKR